MTGKLLYTQAIPTDSQQGQHEQYRRQLSKSGAIDSEEAAIEDVSLEPGEEELHVTFRGRHAEVMKEELRQLFESEAHDVVPFSGYDFGEDEPIQTEDDGYYYTESIDVDRLDPRFETAGESGQDIYELRGRIVKEGTRESYWRAVDYELRSAHNPFADSGDVFIAVPEPAEKVRWFDPVTGEKEFAEPSATVDAEFVDLERYELDDPEAGDAGLLLYTIDYTTEGKADAKVWDTLNKNEKTVVEVGGEATEYQHWHKVFSNRHEFTGALVLDNEVLRVTFDRETAEITAERYTDGEYETVDLGASDWQVFDADLTRASQTADDVQVEFTDGEEFFVLDGRLRRGFEDVLWTVPPNQSGATPDGLMDLLEPIASGESLKVQSSKGVEPRGEVRL